MVHFVNDLKHLHLVILNIRMVLLEVCLCFELCGSCVLSEVQVGDPTLSQNHI